MKVPGIDLSLSGGAVVGGLALTLAAPFVLGMVGTALKAVAKTGIKGSLMAYGKGKELVNDAQKSLVEITREAKSEAAAELKSAKR
ncbi:MAG: hypothetical protein PVI69_07775 [Desulfobacterales bacterium]|jgi:hypothetical protein